MKLLLIPLLTAACSACTLMPPEPLAHSKGFTPVFPVELAAPREATGAIYNGRQSERFFGRGQSFQIGDVITVLLNESTQAARTQNGKVSRTASNDIPALSTNFLKGGLLQGDAKMLGSTIKNEGVGTADQTASLTGSIAVSVIEVMSNGNLVLRGEKQLALTEGSEIIQVGGIVRPDDIAPNNTVQSRRLANAQITYRGTGDMAAATRTGWGTSALLKIWPF
ncbi:MAG: flagellar basal body L-ring protein FlgH [Burkholderiaceae bacterium]